MASGYTSNPASPPAWVFSAAARGVPAAAGTVSRLAARLPAPVSRRVTRKAMESLFGGPGDTPQTKHSPDAADTAPLLGVDSVSTRILSDPCGIAGGVRGLMVQTAHPLAMAGVDDHSDFNDDPLARLHSTSAWVRSSAIASWGQVVALANRVRGMHKRVTGTHNDTDYRADDPRLLAWVQLSFTASNLDAYAIWGPDRLTPAEADQFVREQSWVAALLDPRCDLSDWPDRPTDDELDGLPLLADTGLPTTVADLNTWMADLWSDVDITDAARRTLTFLRKPHGTPAWSRASYRILQSGITATLPSPVREAIGGTESPAQGSVQIAGTAALLATLRVGMGANHVRQRIDSSR